MSRTPRELIDLYWNEVWNNQNVDLIREICADPIVRHDPNGATSLSHDEQIKRVSQQSARSSPFFSHEVLLADENYVCSVWNMDTRKGNNARYSGIEVFRAQNGRLTDCWNSSYAPGHWGRTGDPPVPEAMPRPRVLESTKLINNDWIQRVFHECGMRPPRVSFVLQKPIGNGNLSNTVKLYLTYNGNAEDFPRSLVAKFSPTHPLAAAASHTLRAGEREATVYSILAQHDAIPTPKVYFSAFDQPTGQMNLVMQDLSGLTPGDQVKGGSIEQIQSACEELSNLHSFFFGKFEKEVPDWMYDFSESSDRLVRGVNLGAKALGEKIELSSEEQTLLTRLTPYFTEFVAHKPRFETFVHGEPRIDNIIFDMQSPDKPKPYFIDWQFASCHHPVSDISYLLSGSISVEARREHEMDLVKQHAATIQAAHPDFDANESVADYPFYLLWGLIRTLSAAQIMPDGAGGKELLSVLFHRNCAALMDHSVADRLDSWLEAR